MGRNKRVSFRLRAMVGATAVAISLLLLSTFGVSLASANDDTWKPSSSIGEVAARAAVMYVGIKYTWAGDSAKEGFDCSGLTMVAWKVAGKSLPHNSEAQWNASVSHPKRGDLKLGDLIFYSSNGRSTGIHHVAMYVGNGKMVEAPHTGANVRVVDIRSSELLGYGRVSNAGVGSVDFPSNPGNVKGCDDFKTQASATTWFRKYYPFYGDVAHLDSTDKDMQACNKLP